MKFWSTFSLLFFLSIKAVFPVDWIEIPKGNYATILSIDEEQLDEINQLTNNYHSTLKSDLSTRIDLLKAIRKCLTFLSHQEDMINKKGVLLLLDKAVLNKLEYLELLQNFPTDETIEKYHLDCSSLSEKQFKPLTLRNDGNYSLKMKEFWGKFWLESIDPCHRRLANYYQFWLDTNPASTDYKSFFLWLDSQPVQKNVPVVLYYSNEELSHCHVSLINGGLKYSSNQEPVNTVFGKRNLFVIDLAQNLYVETHKEGVWHSSLSRGKPTLGAGLMEIENGIITMIAFESGHYLPSLKQSYQSLQILLQNGVPFHEPLDIIYFEERNKYRVSVSIKQLKDYSIFYEAIHNLTIRELISSNEF